MSWVRALQAENWNPPYRHEDDPAAILEGMLRGESGACRRCAFLLMGALLAAGIRSRVVIVTPGFEKSADSHCMVEFWFPKTREWILLDLTEHTLFKIDDQYLGLFKVFECLRQGRTLEFARRGVTCAPTPSNDCSQKVMRHIFVAKTNAVFDGFRAQLFGRRFEFVHCCDENAGPYPQRLKLMLTGAAGVLLVVGSSVMAVSINR